jgi:hypothetical protein
MGFSLARKKKKKRSVVGDWWAAAKNCHGRSLVGGEEKFKFEDRLCKTTSSVFLYDNLLKKKVFCTLKDQSLW